MITALFLAKNHVVFELNHEVFAADRTVYSQNHVGLGAIHGVFAVSVKVLPPTHVENSENRVVPGKGREA